MDIRLLRHDEIECRVQQVKEKGCILLLYKDARADMRVLDETFGIMGWERKHEIVNGNLFCTVSCYDKENNRWVSKQDVGTESNTEKEKGQASDAFKRACFNWGIGRELYSSPFIWITLFPDEIKSTGNNKFSLNFGVEFLVKEIHCNQNREIDKLIIVDKKGKERFVFGSKQQIETPQNSAQNTNKENQTNIQTIEEKHRKALYASYKNKNISDETFKAAMKSITKKEATKDLTMAEFKVLMTYIENYKEDNNGN